MSQAKAADEQGNQLFTDFEQGPFGRLEKSKDGDRSSGETPEIGIDPQNVDENSLPVCLDLVPVMRSLLARRGQDWVASDEEKQQLKTLAEGYLQQAQKISAESFAGLAVEAQLGFMVNIINARLAAVLLAAPQAIAVPARLAAPQENLTLTMLGKATTLGKLKSDFFLPALQKLDRAAAGEGLLWNGALYVSRDGQSVSCPESAAIRAFFRTLTD